jgi:lysophospholipase L1-like esterase
MLKPLIVCALCCAGARGDTPLHTARMLEEGGAPVRVVCFGDSITGRYYHSGNRRAWPEMLKLALARLYPDADVTVINAGVSGNTSAQGLARMQKDVFDHNPHLVAVMFGMNDLAYGAVTPEQDAAKKTAFTGNLCAIVERCRAADAEVLLCTQNPVYPEALPSRPPERVGEFAGIIRQTGAELGVPVVDVYTAWDALRMAEPRAWRLLMSETIHPSMAGHKRIAEQVAGTLSGRAVSLTDVQPEQPVCGGFIARLKEGKPVAVVAPASLEPHIRAMVLRRYPSAALTVIPTSAADGSLDALVAEHQGVRAKAPHLVFVSLRPGILAFDNEEAFVRQVSWLVNYALPFGGTAWTAVGVDPAWVNPGLTQQQREGSELLRAIVRGHDLDWIGAAPAVQEAMDAWFWGQVSSAEGKSPDRVRITINREMN